MPDYGPDDSYLKGDEKLLAEIRTRFDYCQDQWKDIRDEAAKDMKYIAGNPWPEAEKKLREDKGRPCMVMDELSQYVNQVVNDVRQSKRAVRVVPRGYGANDKMAELRGDLIREIEYKSNAQTAYCRAFQNTCERSYGGWKIVRRYVSEKSFDQEIRIVGIPNPDCSYPDPDAKEGDFSDAKYWFLIDTLPRKEYKKKYPKAKITDFNGDHIKVAPNWIKEDQIQIAEYWRVELKARKLYLVQTKQGPLAMFDDELPEGFDEKRTPILKERDCEQKQIKQYITNGVEILEGNDEPGDYIPIVWLIGKELYVESDIGPKRIWESMIRKARDPQMMVNYCSTTEAEAIGMTPKTPFIAIEGQLVQPEQWQAANTTPVSVLLYKATTEQTGQTVLPPPQRQPYTPQIEPLEIARESARRGVQASMGLSALPVNAQRLNDKSGVALKQIDANEDRGSFHFIDNYEMALEYSGRIINNKLKYVYDAAREIGIRKNDEQHETVKINQPTKNEKGEDEFLDMKAGEYEVTISTGPSFQSEREKADAFVEEMLPVLEGLPLDPTVKARLLALLVKLRNVGSVGDEIVKLLSPDQSEQQLQGQLQQLTSQQAQSQQIIAQLQAENQIMHAEKNGKIVDNEYAVKLKQMDIESRIAVAEIGSKAQIVTERESIVADLMGKLGLQMRQLAHDAAMQAMQHAHEADQSQQMAQQLAAQQAQNQPTNGNQPNG